MICRERGAGVLCHISSLPNRYGIGGLGQEAYSFADFLKKSHIKYWQILPLVQTGYGDSPYQSVGCSSGNPYFIDLEQLAREGLLTEEELLSAERECGAVDYGDLYSERYALLRRAYSRFDRSDKRFIAFIESGEFEDYALFMSLKSRYGGTFSDFPEAFKYKEPYAVYEFRKSVYAEEYCFWLFLQFKFAEQWKKLKAYVNGLGIKIIGDIPLYVAYDSADVWGRSELFLLDEDLNPVSVAGVPPDYFSEEGQLWGNPLYNWDALEAEDFRWWTDRIKKAAQLYDVIRIDHFRGLDRYYAIPAGSSNAVVGEWRRGPAMKLFNAIYREAAGVEIIAEDLGVMDEGVIKLRTEAKLPGMKIMQFAFDGSADNDYLPANISEASVVYTGTHDNDTTLGFLNEMTDKEFALFKGRLRAALKSEGLNYPVYKRADAVTAMCMCAMSTRACLAVLPVQDMLALDTSARMNIPSTSSGNWRFRLAYMPANADAARLRRMVKKSGRE